MKLPAAPSWIQPPRDVGVLIDDNAVFRCEATGEPAPDIQWFINARPIESVPHFFHTPFNAYLFFRNPSVSGVSCLGQTVGKIVVLSERLKM